MVLYDIFYIGQQALRASQYGVRTASENVSNVNTPGYNRREMVLRASSLTSRGRLRVGHGVEIETTQRILDNTLNRRVRDAGSKAASSGARSNILARANVVFGDLLGGGVSSNLDDFFASLDFLASNPQDATARTNVVGAAQRLSESINDYGFELRALQREIDPQIDAEVDEANRLAYEIAQLNNEISRSVNPSNDLLDRRERLVDELSKTIGIDVIPREDGSWDVALEGGYTLIAKDNVQPLRTVALDGKLRVEGRDGGGARDLTGTIRRGELGGLLQARDEDLESTLDRVNQWTFDLVSEINTRHAAGFGLDGVTGRNLFAPPAGVDGAAAALAVDPDIAADPGRLAAAGDPTLLPGDNANALSLAAMRLEGFMDGLNPPDALRGVLQEFGDRAFSANATAQSQGIAEAQLMDLRSSLSGVSIDEEMATLMKFRQSYQAAATIIRTADELTQEIIALKR